MTCEHAAKTGLCHILFSLPTSVFLVHQPTTLLQAWKVLHQTGTMWFLVCSVDVLRTHYLLSDMLLCILPAERSSMILRISHLNQKL